MVYFIKKINQYILALSSGDSRNQKIMRLIVPLFLGNLQQFINIMIINTSYCEKIIVVKC